MTTGIQPLLGVDVWEVSGSIQSVLLLVALYTLLMLTTSSDRLISPPFGCQNSAARVLPAIQEPSPRLRQRHLENCQLEGGCGAGLHYFFRRCMTADPQV